MKIAKPKPLPIRKSTTVDLQEIGDAAKRRADAEFQRLKIYAPLDLGKGPKKATGSPLAVETATLRPVRLNLQPSSASEFQAHSDRMFIRDREWGGSLGDGKFMERWRAKFKSERAKFLGIPENIPKLPTEEKTKKIKK